MLIKPNDRACMHSRVTLCDPMDCSPQASLSMGLSRQKYWRGLPFPPPEDLSDPGIEPKPPTSPELTGGFFTTETPGKPKLSDYHALKSP